VTSSFAPRKPSRRAPLLLVALALLAGGETAPEQVAMDALQKRYDGYRDLRARFVQTSTSAAFPETSVSKGTVLVQRPGRIRWNYDDGRVIVLDGDSIRLFDPEDRQLQIAPLEEGGVSPTALSFLMGGARLRDDFTAKVAPAQAGAEPAFGLELVPRGEPSFESLVLWLDPETYELRESVLVDLFGNRTRLALSGAVYNAGLEPDAFRLEVPEGTEEIDLRTKR
jgi:outer membrane lipoprotein carrier protein